jgi:GT2 family glycosyltransferase
MKNSRLIVVLGMHRSGTSAVTRGLQVLGVKLGERLIPPIEDNNAKGFWEDIDLNTLDNEMLSALDRDWHHLTPILPGDVEALHKKGFFLRAVELLRQKVGRATTFGIKDPRVAKLLLFWKDVFVHCQLDVSYVIVVRNPLSVAKSLDMRDGFDAEKSYLLWLGHVITSLTCTVCDKRVFIDYDRLLQSPDNELNRIAKSLDLEIDQAELQSYKAAFLDQGLRHTVYDLSDLLSDYTCPPLVCEVYTALLDVASDITQIDDLALQNQITHWVAEFERLKSLLSLIDRLYTQKAVVNQRVAQRDCQIANINQAVAERDAQINSLNRTAAERDAQVVILNQVMAERDWQIASLNRTAAERDAQINSLNRTAAERDAQVVILNQVMAKRDGQIASLNQAVVERDGQIFNLSQTVTEWDEKQACYQAHVVELEHAVYMEQRAHFSVDSEAASLRNQLNAIIVSRSWKLTAPLRLLFAVVYRAPALLYSRAIAVYRTLPISPVQKQKLKNSIFRAFGFAFVRLEVYQHWKSYQQIGSNWSTIKSSAPTIPAISEGSRSITTLPSADGTWEWSDYGNLKSRIAQIKAERLSQFFPSPLNLIDIGYESFASAAARVNLPRLVAAPEVSIILPVFNNLKITLECLLSISAHSDSSVSYEIIVANDASTDETAQIIESIPNLRFIHNESNLGFLRNCNSALEHVQGNYVLYLNNDVQVSAGWLKTLLETFESYPNVGAVGPRFLYPSGHLQEAGAAFRPDGMADMVGLNEDASQARFSYARRVDYVSGACLMLPAKLVKKLEGFSEDYLPCYCEDSDLCLRVQEAGYFVYCNPASTVIHHLSKTTGEINTNFKMHCITNNLVTLQNKWQHRLERSTIPKVIAFYLPQFHPFAENDKWWGSGFTEWANVTKAQPNFVGHYQPRFPADLGYYDLRLNEVMSQQAELARRYGIEGFCFYYYWFNGKRLLDRPIEQMLENGTPDFPFCLCWANENWTRRWDGQDHEVLMSQSHSHDDDSAVILDLMRFFNDKRYIRIDGRPLILVYRVTIFPNFVETADRWRTICREQGIGEIYICMVESFELVHTNTNPRKFGCDAAVEFPPQGLAELKQPSGEVINLDFSGSVADYRDLALRYATREVPAYTRFMGVMPGWDNTARRQNNSFCFEHATPGAFQAWLAEAIEQTRIQHYGDERLIFVNAWNEWAEGAYLEPDRRFGHAFLEAVRNALESASLLRKDKYGFGITGDE